mgnify:CR=1 FL=1
MTDTQIIVTTETASVEIIKENKEEDKDNGNN